MSVYSLKRPRGGGRLKKKVHLSVSTWSINTSFDSKIWMTFLSMCACFKLTYLISLSLSFSISLILDASFTKHYYPHQGNGPGKEDQMSHLRLAACTWWSYGLEWHVRKRRKVFLQTKITSTDDCVVMLWLDNNTVFVLMISFWGFIFFFFFFFFGEVRVVWEKEMLQKHMQLYPMLLIWVAGVDYSWR